MENQNCIPVMDKEHQGLMEKFNSVKTKIKADLKGLTVSQAKSILQNLINWELDNETVI